MRARQIFAAGITLNAIGDFDFSVRAYDTVDGTLLWEDYFDLDGGSDQACGVAVAGKQVYVAGRSEDATGNLDWLLRTYRAADGELLWQDQFDRAGNADEAMAVAVLGHAVFIGGRTDSLLGNTDFTVRAYRR